MLRLKTKVLRVNAEVPLQTRLNTFTRGKNIAAVYGLDIQPGFPVLTALLVYGVEDDETKPPESRVLAKVFDYPLDDMGQKVSSFSKGRRTDVLYTYASVDESRAVSVIFYRGDA